MFTSNIHREIITLRGQISLLNTLILKGEEKRLNRSDSMHVATVQMNHNTLTGTVEGNTGNYQARVTFNPRGFHCTCADFRSARKVGPCKHVLALAIEGRDTMEAAIKVLEQEL